MPRHLTAKDRVRFQRAQEMLQEAQYLANEAAAQLSGVSVNCDGEYKACSELGDQAQAAHRRVRAKLARYPDPRAAAA
jgi:hypothetical protein